MTDEAPRANEIILGDVTIVLSPPEAAVLSQMLGHVLFTAPELHELNEEQQARVHFLGSCASKLSLALIQAMRDAGMTNEAIERATGVMQAPEAPGLELPSENGNGEHDGTE